MKDEYKFGIGEIREVLRGEVDKANSFDELDLASSSSKIIIPKIMGVYQENETNPEYERFLNEITQFEVFLKIEKKENMSKDLICVAYDPTIIPGDILRKTLEGDVLGRLKCIEYCSLEGFPEFNEKNCPDLDIIRKTSFEPSECNITLLERSKNYLELLRQDYGLTIFEAIGFEASKGLLIKLGRLTDIIDDPLLIKLTQDNPNLLKGLDFQSFLRREKRN